MRNLRTTILAILLFCAFQNAMLPARGWSVDGHMIIVHYASKILPAPWNQFFNYYGWLLNETTVYPDTYYREMDPNDAPRHFIDLEVWNPNAPSTGTLPQAVEEFTLRMQSAIETKDWNNVLLYAGRVAHYMADDTQPYHTTINYNPRSRTGVELHEVLDSSLGAHFPEFKISDSSEIGPLTPIRNLTRFVLDTAIQSHSFLPTINRALIDQGLEWSPDLTKIIENRTNTAIVAVARVWFTAISRAATAPPELPQPNHLSIIVENTTHNSGAPVTIRLNVTDAIGVKTYADVMLSAGNMRFQAQVANVVPPVGEYVIVLSPGYYSSLILTARREEYTTGTRTVNVASNTLTTSSLPSTVSPVTVPLPTIVASMVMIGATLTLIWYRRRFKGS